jgi:hypothetical protein
VWARLWLLDSPGPPTSLLKPTKSTRTSRWQSNPLCRSRAQSHVFVSINRSRKLIVWARLWLLDFPGPPTSLLRPTRPIRTSRWQSNLLCGSRAQSHVFVSINRSRKLVVWARLWLRDSQGHRRAFSNLPSPSGPQDGNPFFYAVAGRYSAALPDTKSTKFENRDSMQFYVVCRALLELRER